VVRSQDAKHVKAGTQVVRARNVRGAEMGKLLSYLSKYMGKLQKHTVIDRVTGEILSTGRAWGSWGDLPIVEMGTVEMDWPTYRVFCERVNEWGRSAGSWYLAAINEGWRGYVLLGDGLELFGRLTEGLDVTYCPRRGAPLQGVVT